MQDSNVKSTIEAVAGLVKAIPVYEDALQPAAKEVGKALGTVAKTIHVALAPISALVWGYDQIKDFVSTRVAEKLKNIPEGQICTPNPMLAGPALEALKYTGHEETLSEMYANLLATSLDSSTAATAHPAYVEVIKQLTPPEAVLIHKLLIKETYPEVCSYMNTRSSKYSWFLFSNEHAIQGIFCKICNEILSVSEDEAMTFLDNLRRLQILEIDVSTSQRVNDNHFMHFDEHRLRNASDLFEIEQQQNEIIRFTTFGVKFVNACVKDRT